MATIKVVLDKRYKHVDDTFPIAIRISHKNKTKYKPVGFAVKDKQFAEGLANWVNSKHPDAVNINALIEDARSEVVGKYTKLQLEKRPFDFGYLMSDTPSVGHTLGEVLVHISEVKDKADEINQSLRQLSLKRQVISCLGKDPCLNDLGLVDVEKIVAYFRNGDPEKGYKPNRPNTLNRKMRFLGDAYTVATKLWPKDISPSNPFRLIKTKREKVNKVKLSWDQIVALENMELSGMYDLARDMYLASLYLQGMRFENVLTIERENTLGTHYEYRMNKGKALRKPIIHPKLRRIFDKYYNSGGPYLFPLLKKVCKTKRELYYAKDDANYDINFYLKRIGEMLGEKYPLTFHTARHTYAMLLKRFKIDPWISKDSLGHAHISTTEEYQDSLDDDDINEAVTPVFYQ